MFLKLHTIMGLLNCWNYYHVLPSPQGSCLNTEHTCLIFCFPSQQIYCSKTTIQKVSFPVTKQSSSWGKNFKTRLSGKHLSSQHSKGCSELGTCLGCAYSKTLSQKEGGMGKKRCKCGWDFFWCGLIFVFWFFFFSLQRLKYIDIIMNN